ncbi:hypothetical protein K8I85_06590, partial [bacterium]|nr:hypothetical protein [bacterium]
VDTCSGTRVHLAPGGEPAGFDDVPARFVPGQLNALSGMDVLRDVSAHAPREDDPDGTQLIGLLDLKGLAHGGVAPVREARDLAAEPIAVIRSYDDVESREFAYEQPGAVVLARVDGWSRVRLPDGAAGWIAPEDAGTWFPYAELPVRRLNYLTGHWSGYVWPDAGAGLPVRSPRRHAPGREEYPAEVHESMLVGGMIWFRVDVLNGNPCDGGDVRPELSGWVPGYGADGEPTVWFWSRGC